MDFQKIPCPIYTRQKIDYNELSGTRREKNLIEEIPGRFGNEIFV